MFRVSVCDRENENSHFMDVFEALDTGLHTAGVILLNLFHHSVRWIPTEKEPRLGGVPKSHNQQVEEPECQSSLSLNYAMGIPGEN